MNSVNVEVHSVVLVYARARCISDAPDKVLRGCCQAVNKSAAFLTHANCYCIFEEFKVNSQWLKNR
jgi:hypothetical protein